MVREKNVIFGKILIGFVFFVFFVGVVFGVGFHHAEEVRSGTFIGDYDFAGNVDFRNALTIDFTGANVIGLNISVNSSNNGTLWNRSGLNDIYYNGGNVGIGTSSPATKLHVSNLIISGMEDSVMGGLIATGAGPGSYEGGEVALYNSADYDTSSQYWGIDSYQGEFRIYTDALGEKLRIKQNGNVGIGTTNPGYKLHLADVFPAINLEETDFAGDDFNIQVTDGIFRIAESGVAARLAIDTNGNVGIGTTAPGYKLEVEGRGIKIDSSDTWAILWYDSASGDNSGTLTLANDIFYMGRYGDNFGSWINNPFQFELDTGVAKSSTGSWTVQSDIRLKDNITNLKNSLDKVLKLQGVEFDWKNGNGHTLGVIAQDVEIVVPELVFNPAEGSQDDYKSVDYGRFTPLLIEAIKEQQQQIELLEARIDELENK